MVEGGTNDDLQINYQTPLNNPDACTLLLCQKGQGHRTHRNYEGPGAYERTMADVVFLLSTNALRMQNVEQLAT
jgi:hypothetical protein